jgi:haloalkane dehalogenase
MNSDRVKGIVHMEMEAIAEPMNWSDLPEQARPFFQAIRSPAGDRMVLEENISIEKILPAAMLRPLTDEEIERYRKPFLKPGEDRGGMAFGPRGARKPPVGQQYQGGRSVLPRRRARGGQCS